MQDNNDIPKGYFEKLPEKVMDRIEEEELQKAAPTLFGIEKKNPFVVAPGYFDGLPTAVRQRTSTHGTPKTAFDLRIVMAAASVTIVMLMSWGWFNVSTSTNKNVSTNRNTSGNKTAGIVEDAELNPRVQLAEEVQALEIEEVEVAVESELIAMSENEIIDAISVENIEDLQLADVAIEASENAEAETAAIVDYLVDYDVNLEDVIAEL